MFVCLPHPPSLIFMVGRGGGRACREDPDVARHKYNSVIVLNVQRDSSVTERSNKVETEMSQLDLSDYL